MKGKMIVTTGMALALITVGSMSAFAADAPNRCVDAQAMQQFTQETAALQGELKAKELELSQLSGYWGVERGGYDGPDFSTMDRLNAERKEIKNKIAAAALKYGIQPCCTTL